MNSNSHFSWCFAERIRAEIGALCGPNLRRLADCEMRLPFIRARVQAKPKRG
jgi:hypothetical protein